jgi:hypothetical protein
MQHERLPDTTSIMLLRSTLISLVGERLVMEVNILEVIKSIISSLDLDGVGLSALLGIHAELKNSRKSRDERKIAASNVRVASY